MTNGSGRSGGVSVLPWIVCVAIGIVLIVIGIVLHSSPVHRGGPITLGIILVVGGAAKLLRQGGG